jgi:hypothetical protein
MPTSDSTPPEPICCMTAGVALKVVTLTRLVAFVARIAGWMKGTIPS